jgi:hypothetical protein
MLEAALPDVCEAVVKEYGAYTYTTEEARKALENIKNKMRDWFCDPGRTVTVQASKSILTFSDAELDFLTPSNRGLGRVGEKMPRLGARHRLLVSQMDTAASRRLHKLVQGHILCGYIFSEYRYSLSRAKDPPLADGRLYRMWIPTIYSSMALQLDPRNKDEEELKTLWFGATGRDLRDFLQAQGVKWEHLDTLILTAYFNGGTLLRLLEAAPLSDDQLTRLSTGGMYPA